MTIGAVHILYNGLRGGGFRNLLYALYVGERGVFADVI